MQETLSDYLQTVEALIMENMIDDVIQALLKLDKETGAGIRNDVLLQSGNYKQVKGSYDRMEIDDRTYFSMTARTRSALLEIVKKIPARLQLNEKLKNYYQFTVEHTPAYEKILANKDNLKSLDWLHQLLRSANAVCRITAADGSNGTGFLTKDGYIFTNNHVLAEPRDAEGATVEFNFQHDASGAVTQRISYELDASDFLTSDKFKLDFTRVKVKDRDDQKLSQWGFLEFDLEAVPKIGDQLVIIQHPQGKSKRVAIGANEVVAVNKPYINYTVETEEGSSGSPILNDQMKVVAIHHAARKVDVNGKATDTNEGVLFKEIFKTIGG